jgi:hypothetical protein
LLFFPVLGDGRLHGEMDEGQLNGIPVDACAQKIIKAIQHKKKHLIIARSEKLFWWFWCFARNVFYYLAYKYGRLLNKNLLTAFNDLKNLRCTTIFQGFSKLGLE